MSSIEFYPLPRLPNPAGRPFNARAFAKFQWNPHGKHPGPAGIVTFPSRGSAGRPAMRHKSLRTSLGHERENQNEARGGKTRKTIERGRPPEPVAEVAGKHHAERGAYSHAASDDPLCEV